VGFFTSVEVFEDPVSFFALYLRKIHLVSSEDKEMKCYRSIN
jgi:hypothetical protein